jgi:hypothetical protein
VQAENQDDIGRDDFYSFWELALALARDPGNMHRDNKRALVSRTASRPVGSRPRRVSREEEWHA